MLTPAARSGSAALEFSIVAPVMLTLLIGSFELTRAFIVWQQVYTAAHLIAVSASSLAVQPDKTTSLTVQQAQQALSGIYAALPWRRSGVLTGVTSVTMTSVTFVLSNPACTGGAGNCAYAPTAVWSVPYTDFAKVNTGSTNTFKQATRPCIIFNQVPPGQITPGDMTSLPTASVTSPDPLLVVDVHYQYTPVFAKSFTGPLDFWATSYAAVRSAAANTATASQYTRYDIANSAGGVGKCPGYT